MDGSEPMKLFARIVAGMFLALTPPVCLAQESELVAVVDLKYLKETEQVVAIMCYGDLPEDCHPWAHGYLFEARVRKVINGQAPKGKFLVIYGHHAMKKENLRGVVGRFSKLTDGTDGAEYQIAARAVEGDLACFDWWGLDGSGAAERPSSGSLLRCFNKDYPVAPVVDSSPLHDPEKTLREANDAYNKAIIDGDVAALEKLFAREFTYTSTSGEIVDRAAQLEQFRSNTLDIESGVGSEEKVQIHGKTGVVVGRFDAKGMCAGKPFVAAERYTSVWVVRDDRWQLVAEQGTLVHAGH
jgi:ketosteroid isomerase-like protein